MTFIPDESQKRVIDITRGHHLVLAPPGCGKTQILTERVRRAHAVGGIDYADMLCLTFTNRAARGMFERIESHISDEDVSKVYVGNIHRFCSKWLFEEGCVPAETSIIDDNDSFSILATQLGEDEARVMENGSRRRAYIEMLHFSHLMKQMRSGHDTRLRMHPECFTSEDVQAVRKICEVQQMPLSAETVLDIYDNYDFYITATHTDGYDIGSQAVIGRLLMKMQQAHTYERYKRENMLMDFEDLLIVTYDELRSDDNHRRYKWIQVDEVQDLNGMQLAIVDELTDTLADDFTVVYLGDGQQAIFSFMGAKLSTLGYLRDRCGANVHSLNTNHRSPDYLLEVFNTYAADQLNVDRTLLPRVALETKEREREMRENKALTPYFGNLRVFSSNVIETEYYDAAHVADELQKAFPDNTTAVVVNANADADFVSAELMKLGVPHLKVSGEDMFASETMRLIVAHLNVLWNEHSFIAWARLMAALGVFASGAYARNFVRHCLDRAMLPSDFLLYDDSTYTHEFVSACDGEVVVFDTETTGLDVFGDDIAQIAAMRMRGGKVVEGSEFNVYIRTRRAVPLKLGDIDNPLVGELARHELLEPDEALRRFAEYAGGATLIGHNADFDYHILRENYARYVGENDFGQRFPRYFDTLKLTRLLVPYMRQYKLKSLLAVLGLEGDNSHLADDDVRATCSLVAYCLDKARAKSVEQREFMARQRVKDRVLTLRRNYSEEFLRARKIMYEQQSLVDEIQHMYRFAVENGFSAPLVGIKYVTGYIASDVIEEGEANVLAVQLGNHIMELNTMREADLCGSRSMEDRVFVTTVHKAKGLEFDNVLIFDAVEDRYPSYFNRDNPAGIAEDARKFYVAMTRARRRLYVFQCLSRIDSRGNVRPRELTRFMLPIRKFFT